MRLCASRCWRTLSCGQAVGPVRRFVVATPSYLARYGCPKHPDDLMAHYCLGHAYRAKRDVWRLTNKAGDGVTVTPVGPLRVTNVDGKRSSAALLIGA
jgi:DNA-binding transcriptional LysR family regulator